MSKGLCSCGCGRDAKTRGLSLTCYKRARNNGLPIVRVPQADQCSTPGCMRKPNARGLCSRCYSRARRATSPKAPAPIKLPEPHVGVIRFGDVFMCPPESNRAGNYSKGYVWEFTGGGVVLRFDFRLEDDQVRHITFSESDLRTRCFLKTPNPEGRVAFPALKKEALV